MAGRAPATMARGLDRRLRLQILIDNVEPRGAQHLLPGFAIAAQRADRARVRNHLAESRPDVLHTHLGGSDFLGGIAAKALGIPAISTLHQVSWQTGSPRDKVKYRLQALARRRCAANVIAVCEAVRERYLSRRWDKPSRVVTVHNGIANQSEPGAGRKVRDELGLAPTDLVMTMVSVLRRDKAGMLPPDSVLTVAGHDVAVPAMRALAGEFPDVRLVVVGDGPDRAVVEGAMSS